MEAGYSRTTITVPLALKARMKSVAIRVNWSAVACRAFEAELREAEPVPEITSMDEALERMKSLAKSDEGERLGPNHAGVVAGRRWAMNQANPNQLKRLESFRDSMSLVDWRAVLISFDGSIELARCIDDGGHSLRRSGTQQRRSDRLSKGDLSEHEARDLNRVGLPRGVAFGHGSACERVVWQSILASPPTGADFFWGFATGALEVWGHVKDQL